MLDSSHPRDLIQHMTGSPPMGWYTGRDSPNTRRLVVDHNPVRHIVSMDVGGPALPPGRASRLLRLAARFLDHVQQHERVWTCRRADIARHWHAVHAPGPRATKA